MKYGKMVLIAYHLLESSIGAYIEWLVNKLMMTANKIEYKDARLVMLPQIQKPTSQISLALSDKSCLVQLCTQGFIPLL